MLINYKATSSHVAKYPGSCTRVGF
jgi:hypothetical protein